MTTSAPEAGAGALIEEALEDAPAARAGLRAGDVIVSVGGRRIRGPDDVAAAIEDRRPGHRVEIEYRRGSTTRSVVVRLGVRPTP